MIVTIIFGIILMASAIIICIGVKIENHTVFTTGLIIGGLSFIMMMVASDLESSEVRTACKTYCQEQGHSYDSVKWEGEEQYCVCDTSLDRHLIKQNTGVIIE